MNETAMEIAIAQANERLRQERETFDEEKTQYRKWFRVKHVMGWIVALMLPTILIISAVIIFDSKAFDALTVRIATAALLADTLGTILALYKLILGSQPNTSLRPVTAPLERDELTKPGDTSLPIELPKSSIAVVGTAASVLPPGSNLDQSA